MPEAWVNGVILVVAGLIVFGVVLLIRHRVPAADVEHPSWSATLSYVATAYGVVVGFSILFLFGQFADARQAVGDEATSIGTAYEQAYLFPDSQTSIQRALICYARAVPIYDWPALREHQGGAPEVDAAYHDLVVSVGVDDQPPVGALHAGTATNLVSQIGAISTARETRLVTAETQLPAMLWILLIGGGAFVVMIIFVVTLPAKPTTQAVLVAMSSVFTLVLLLIVMALSEPFGVGSGRASPQLIEETAASMTSTATGGVGAPCRP
ncbi:MAG: DUF4239 domain-containing protein [Microlunatus sp.]|nr:DUF4239 domain-containing protein [Microlunatus sp.]